MIRQLIACAILLPRLAISQEDWDEKMNAAKAALDAHQYQEADRIYSAAIAECRAACASEVRFGRALFELGVARLGQARNFEAADLFQRGIAVLGSNPGIAPSELAIVWEPWAACIITRSCSRKLKSHTQAPSKSAKPRFQPIRPLLPSFSPTWDWSTSNNSCDQGAQTLERARALQKQYEKNSAISRAALINNIGILRRSCGSPEQAEQAFRDALQLLESCQDRNGILTATVLNNLAVELMHRNDYIGAGRLFERALEDMPTSWEHADVVRILHNHAACHRKQGKRKEARRLDSRAESIVRATPENERNLVDVSELRLEAQKPSGK